MDRIDLGGGFCYFCEFNEHCHWKPTVSVTMQCLGSKKRKYVVSQVYSLTHKFTFGTFGLYRKPKFIISSHKSDKQKCEHSLTPGHHEWRCNNSYCTDK